MKVCQYVHFRFVEGVCTCKCFQPKQILYVKQPFGRLFVTFINMTTIKRSFQMTNTEANFAKVWRILKKYSKSMSYYFLIFLQYPSHFDKISLCVYHLEASFYRSQIYKCNKQPTKGLFHIQYLFRLKTLAGTNPLAKSEGDVLTPLHFFTNK